MTVPTDEEIARRAWVKDALLLNHAFAEEFGQFEWEFSKKDWLVGLQWKDFPVGQWILLAISEQPSTVEPCAVFQQLWLPDHEQAARKLTDEQLKDYAKAKIKYGLMSLLRRVDECRVLT